MWRVLTTSYYNGKVTGRGLSCKEYASKSYASKIAKERTFENGNYAIESTIVNTADVVVRGGVSKYVLA